MHADVRYSFGPFRLDPAERTLTREGRPVRLTPKDVGVLLALVERHGSLVDRERLFAEVWPGVVVEDCNLARHVATLRQALGDVADAPTYIETLPRRGYRFVAPVEAEAASPAPPPAPTLAPSLVEDPGAAPRDEQPALQGGPPAGPGEAPLKARRTASWLAPGRRRTRVLAALCGAACLGLLGWLSAGLPAGAVGPIRSLAVLPVSNLTGDPRQDHLAEALGAMMLTDMGRRPEISVASPGSSRRYDRSALSARDIGRDLEVEGLFEAAIVRADGQIRVTAELVDTRTDRLVWAEVFEGDACDLLVLQDLIADAVVEALGLQPWTAVHGGAARPIHPEAGGLTCAAEADAAR